MSRGHRAGRRKAAIRWRAARYRGDGFRFGTRYYGRRAGVDVDIVPVFRFGEYHESGSYYVRLHRKKTDETTNSAWWPTGYFASAELAQAWAERAIDAGYPRPAPEGGPDV